MQFLASTPATYHSQPRPQEQQVRIRLLSGHGLAEAQSNYTCAITAVIIAMSLEEAATMRDRIGATTVTTIAASNIGGGPRGGVGADNRCRERGAVWYSSGSNRGAA